MINIKPFTSPYEYVQITKLSGHSISLKAGEVAKAEVVDILPTGAVVIRLKGNYITVRTEIPLQKDTSLLLKILELPVDNRLKLQLISVLDEKGNLSVNNEALKDIELSSLSKVISNENLNEFEKIMLSNIIRNRIKKANVEEGMLKNISFLDNFTPEKLKNSIFNSGVFFEAKMKKLTEGKKVDIKNDLKAALMKELSQESILDYIFNRGDLQSKKELLNDIIMYQFLSKLTNSVYTHIPSIFKGIKYLDVSLKKEENGSTFIKIDICFEEKGRVMAIITYYEGSLNVFFKFEDDNFRKVCESNIKQLKEKLINFSPNFFFFGKETDFDKLETFEISKHILELKI